MPDIQVSDKLISFLFFLPFFFVSLAIHEFAHSFFANKFGDDTSKNLGRLTLNPVKHIDFIGSILMPLASFASGLALIGWAKPVPIDKRKFRNPVKDDIIVSFAGPFSNLLLAILFIFTLSLLYHLGDETNLNKTVVNILFYGIYLNIFLFAFNLLPIPPLDGSHILFDLFPNKYTAAILNFGFYGSFILLIFIYSPLWKYFTFVINSILELFFKLFQL
ncbi:MAG: site-2 protease family protein [Ignavibacterium sp.]